MVIPDPGCPLDQASAQIIQDLLQSIERDADKICDALGPDRRNNKECAYFEGIRDATKIILDRLSLRTRYVHQRYTHMEDYLLGHNESENWIT